MMIDQMPIQRSEAQIAVRQSLTSFQGRVEVNRLPCSFCREGGFPAVTTQPQRVTFRRRYQCEGSSSRLCDWDDVAGSSRAGQPVPGAPGPCRRLARWQHQGCVSQWQQAR